MRLAPLLLLALFAPLAGAQEPVATQRASGATVSGVVYDSIAGMPLSGAMVQLVDAANAAGFSRGAIADPLGRFALRDVPDGRYTIGFVHAMLDSLGMAPPLRQVVVAGQQPVRADLAIPSPARFRAAICGPRSALDSSAVVMGVVRDAASGEPAAGATVGGRWLELTFGPSGISRQTPTVSATTGDNGWFALCNVPRGGTMSLLGARGADSTDVLELQVPAAGFLRRELYLGAARSTGAPAADTVAPRRVGDGRLSGTVVSVDGARPVVGAQVGIADGPRVRTNDAGEWTLARVPAGTRMLEVRALGFYPQRQPVDVVPGAGPVRVALPTLQAMLDTVRVTATRIRLHGTGFDERARTGQGRFLTQDDIARRQPFNVSDVLRAIPGVQVTRTGLSTSILVRGMGAEWCEPAVYIDGNYMHTLTTDDLDGWLSPKDIAGIEVYAGGNVPPQYQQSLSSCGSIVYWTTRGRGVR